MSSRKKHHRGRQGAKTVTTQKSRPSYVYKYLSRNRVGILKDGLIRFTQPGAFNDPFEMRPVLAKASLQYAKDEMHREMTASIERDFGATFSRPQIEYLASSFLDSRKNEIGEALAELADAFCRSLTYKGIPQAFNENIGVLSLSEHPDNLLMWAHYADSHTGFVLELDARHDFFDQKKSEEDELRHLRNVVYSKQRPNWSLDDTSVEYSTLLTKPDVWSYEAEWRLVFELRDAEVRTKSEPFDICLFSLPMAAISSIIFGHRASAQMVSEVIEIVKANSALSHVRLRAAQMHPTDFALVIAPFTSFRNLDTDLQQMELAKEQFVKLYSSAAEMSKAAPAEVQLIVSKLRSIEE